jgi:regulator of sigma E protease
MSKATKSWMGRFNGLFWAAVLGGIVYLILRNLGVVGNVVVVLLGFGAVVLVHEFGHFLIAKLGGIKVEAFSIFMPPTLLGIRKTKGGFKFRFLPSFLGEKEEESADAMEQTEYRIGVFPFGGYVKLLGQEDTGPVKQIDDPRSFANKPVSIRIAVIAAGVTFNVISAAIIFMIVFLVGIHLPPAVVGGVVPNSPAAKADLWPGDEFVMIDGETKDLDFSNIMIAAALSNINESIPVTVRHPDNTEEKKLLVARDLPGSPFREFGIVQPLSLTIAPIAEPGILQERTGLLPGDHIVAVHGKEVAHYWEVAEIVSETLTPKITVTARRATEKGEVELIETELPLEWVHAQAAVESEQDLNHICSMIPRLRITMVGDESAFRNDEQGSYDESKLQPGDVILAVGDAESPNYKEMRDVTKECEGKPLPIRVLRADANGVEQVVTVEVVPKRAPGTDRVLIGIAVALDAAHAVVADTVSVPNGPPALEIPRGARIVSVNGKPVSSFYEILAEIRRWEDRPVVLRYELDGDVEGGVTLPTARAQNAVTVESVLAEAIPFEPLARLYRARGPFHAIAMGYRRTGTFIAQTYITLKRLIGGLISPKNLMGPVGIITVSYQIVAEQPLVNYAYFLGLISATIAVINFLPMPPFDGGLVVLMLIEKIKGSALTERTQGVVAYAGWVLVLILLIYVTFNDIVRSFFS